MKRSGPPNLFEPESGHGRIVLSPDPGVGSRESTLADLDRLHLKLERPPPKAALLLGEDFRRETTPQKSPQDDPSDKPTGFFFALREENSFAHFAVDAIGEETARVIRTVERVLGGSIQGLEESARREVLWEEDGACGTAPGLSDGSNWGLDRFSW